MGYVMQIKSKTIKNVIFLLQFGFLNNSVFWSCEKKLTFFNNLATFFHNFNFFSQLQNTELLRKLQTANLTALEQFRGATKC